MSNPTFYQPFVSTSVTVSSTLNSLQGIKKNGSSPNSYVLTGTTGDAMEAPGYGAIYIGAVDGATTSSGSGSGTWYNFSVPSTWGAQETSAYGPDILTSGSGPGDIGDIALAGTWINSAGTMLGWYYEGSLSALNGDTSGTVTSGFQSFQATTSKNEGARYTYLHSIDGGYVVGNYSTSGGPIGFALNSGPGSGSYIYNPTTKAQVNLSYSDGAKYHSVFGIWANEDQTYTISGGASSSKTSYGKKVRQAVKELRETLPDAAFGKGMLADVDPLTGVTRNIRSYNYINETDGSKGLLTHFQGIYSMGGDVYQAPFVSVTKGGNTYAGNAYIHRLSNGQFSKNALWQTFESTTDGGFAVVATSVAGDADTGVFSNEAPFASYGTNQAYFLQAQTLQ